MTGTGRGGRRPGAGRPKGSTTVVGPTLAESRRSKEASLAALRALELARARAVLLARDDVLRAATDASAAFAQGVARITNLAPELAAETDPDAIRRLLDRRIRETLDQLAEALDRLADGQPSA
jgi:hypothetical protein